MQEAEIRWKKFPWSAIAFVVLSSHLRDNSRSPLTVPVKAGYVSTLLAG